MSFTPRLSSTGMANNPWWYSTASNTYLTWYNRFTNTGNGLPNCTCYAYGRFAEIQGDWQPFANTDLGRESVMLPRGDAGIWWEQATNPTNKYYIGAGRYGQTPQLGAVICWHDPTGTYSGHVAVVEEIHYNSDNTVNYIVTSNSAYGGQYFYTSSIYRVNSYYPSDSYHISYHNDAYRTQGFLYQASQPTPPTPTPTTRRKMPLYMYLHYGI